MWVRVLIRSPTTVTFWYVFDDFNGLIPVTSIFIASFARILDAVGKRSRKILDKIVNWCHILITNSLRCLKSDFMSSRGNPLRAKAGLIYFGLSTVVPACSNSCLPRSSLCHRGNMNPSPIQFVPDSVAGHFFLFSPFLNHNMGVVHYLPEGQSECMRLFSDYPSSGNAS